MFVYKGEISGELEYDWGGNLLYVYEICSKLNTPYYTALKDQIKKTITYPITQNSQNNLEKTTELKDTVPNLKNLLKKIQYAFQQNIEIT